MPCEAGLWPASQGIALCCRSGSRRIASPPNSCLYLLIASNRGAVTFLSLFMSSMRRLADNVSVHIAFCMLDTRTPRAFGFDNPHICAKDTPFGFRQSYCVSTSTYLRSYEPAWRGTDATPSTTECNRSILQDAILLTVCEVGGSQTLSENLLARIIKVFIEENTICVCVYYCSTYYKAWDP
jgi:hypothetical protein